MVHVAGSGQANVEETYAEASVGEYVRVGWLGSVYSWNPLAPVLDQDYVVSHLTHSCLFTYTDDWEEPVGDLALSWSIAPQSDGSMNLYVGITDSAYFRNINNLHDTSRHLTANDVKFTLDLIKSNPGSIYGANLRDVYEVQVLSDFELVIKTSVVRATITHDLAGIPVVPQYIFGYLSRPLSTSINPSILAGSGPFAFESQLVGSWCMFTGAPNYHGEVDHGAERTVDVPGIVYITYSDVVGLAVSMNDGNLDAVSIGDDVNTFVDVLGASSSVDLMKVAVTEKGVCDVAVNAIPPSFRTATYGTGNLHLLDPAVRQALVMSLDKTYIVDVMLKGLATQADSMLQPGYWHADVDELPFDPLAAKSILIAAGYSDDSDGDGYLEATENSYVVRTGLLPVGSELSEIRCHAPDSSPYYFLIANLWAGSASQAGIGVRTSMVSEGVLVNMWYKADYDLWVWHWELGAEPLAGGLNYWLTSEIVPGGYNCQMPMGPWWYGPNNYTDAPDEWGLTGPYSAYDQNFSLAQKTLDVAERKAIIDNLQQWICDSCTESPPYYDFGLYGINTERFTGWGDWKSHPGRTIMSELPWLWFDLVPAGGNLSPVFDVPLASRYSAVLGEAVAFSVTVSDPEGDPLIVNWSFGDSGDTVSDYLSSGTSVPTVVVQTHTYLSVAADLELRVTVDDSQGPPVMCVAYVDVTDGSEERGVQYRWHGMFEEPFGDWWDHRWTYQVVSDSYPYIFGKYSKYSGIGGYYSSMQLDVDARNLHEVNMVANPEFLPFLGTERGGTATIDWYLQYITYEEAAATSPLLLAWYDGWFTRLSGTVTLDATAARGVMGVTDENLDDFDAWWAANEAAFTAAYKSWLVEDAARLGTFSMYEWHLQIVVMDLDACKEGDTVMLSYDIVSWGMEALMTKWLHEAFMPTEWYFEDFSMHAEISPEAADIQIDTAVAGAVFGWKDISTDELSWVWRGMLQDCIPSYETPREPSDFDPYDELTYLSMYAGTQWYGCMVPFEYTPGAFNLSEGEELSFEWPGGPQTFIVADNDYVTAEYEMTVPYSEPSPFDLPEGVSVDPALRTLTFEGPIDMYSWSRDQMAHYYLASEWDRLGVLPYGMPWIEFRASVGAPEPVMLVLENIPYEVGTSQPVNVTLKVVDHYDQVCEDYVGTVYFQSTDPYAVLPEPYTFTAEDAGVHVFEVRFMTGGDQWLGIEDIANPSLSVGIWFNVVPSTIPVASMIYLPLVPSPGETVTFFAFGSYDDGGSIVEYFWDFGDGTYAFGFAAEHVYLERGNYPVTLTVTNACGAQASVTEIVEVGKVGSGVKGVVVSENLKPLRNVDVKVVLNGFVVASARTNGDGEFSVRGLIPGVYDLIFSKRGYADLAMSISVGEGVLDVGTVVLTRDAKTSISASVAEESTLLSLDVCVMLGLVMMGGMAVCRRRR